MKATIDIDPVLYRRLKVEAARSGRTVRALVAEGLRRVLAEPPGVDAPEGLAEESWFASLHRYAANAKGRHDLDAIRRSIARGRRRA
jgi:plasmid stability protein